MRTELMRHLSVVLLIAILLSLSCAGSSPKPSVVADEPGKRIASADVVTVNLQPVEIVAGASAEALVWLKIRDGYHVNANPPSEPYLKPTELEIPASGGIAVDFIVYPDSIKRTFAFAEQPLAVYEGETVLKAVLKAENSAPRGERHLSGKLRIQACDDEVCYPPGTIELDIPVAVR